MNSKEEVLNQLFSDPSFVFSELFHGGLSNVILKFFVVGQLWRPTFLLRLPFHHKKAPCSPDMRVHKMIAALVVMTVT